MYVGDDKRVQLRVDVPAEEIVIVPRLVGDEYELLSARIDVGVACSALPRPSVPARATKTQSRGDGGATHSLVGQPQTSPRRVTGFRTLDRRRDFELNLGSVPGGQEVFAEVDGSPLGAFWDGVTCHGSGRRTKVLSLELLTEVRRNAD